MRIFHLVLVFLTLSTFCLADVNYVFRFQETVDKKLESYYIIAGGGGLKFGERLEYIIPALKNAVNSGKYNIYEIRTFYSDGYLLSAEIIYEKDTVGKGNRLRFDILTGDISLEDKQANRARFSEQHWQFLKGLKNLIKVQEIYDCGVFASYEYYYLAE